ncbi:MAG TPA: hypothetical protein DEH25_07360 [Chloroflexi bacterium]|nr:hypothetical protein [Chloroflexota bacterium]HBY09083.1 hypothetical protein [Chloroflexota bacterium]
MTKLQLNKIVSFLLLASMMLAVFAIPQQVAQAGQPDLVGFTFVNKSDKLASLRLYGNDQFYYFLLKPGEAKYFTPVRGEYRMSFYSCGMYVNKTLDLTKQVKLVVPACGTVAYNGPTPPKVIDGGKIIKLVKVTLENATDRYMKVVLTGPATYVFTFNKDQDKTYTISKGDYNYTVYGCGGSFTGTFYAYANKVFKFKCP